VPLLPRRKKADREGGGRGRARMQHSDAEASAASPVFAGGTRRCKDEKQARCWASICWAWTPVPGRAPAPPPGRQRALSPPPAPGTRGLGPALPGFRAAGLPPPDGLASTALRQPVAAASRRGLHAGREAQGWGHTSTTGAGHHGPLSRAPWGWYPPQGLRICSMRHASASESEGRHPPPRILPCRSCPFSPNAPRCSPCCAGGCCRTGQVAGEEF